ncbi:MAG: GNAT family N-acetyltransferase [Candidatus Krumholzibacteria bacterium]|nr:GNAT family N-acetyltransferase [Candidatus Krumholzibacteria bacterium]
MRIEIVKPWERAEWDAYVASHPGATVYHASAWIRTVCEAGRYEALGFSCYDEDGRLSGVLPAAAVRSALTGNRLTSLPFSDACFPIADDADGASALVAAALDMREGRRYRFFEMRGTPAVREGAAPTPGALGFLPSSHFVGYATPLSADPEVVRRTFSKTAVRQTINKAIKLGVTVRRGEGAADLRAFHDLYARNRRRHGIPPQPLSLFTSLLAHLRGSPEAALYLAEHGGRPLAGLIVVRFAGVTYAKYEGVDEERRDLLPVYPLLWQAIADACVAGDQAFDFGRTATDNPGLMAFKSRWGTESIEMPYYFSPPSEGLSTVRSDSFKYRAFTGVVRRLPASVGVWLGARIFRHFG